MDWLAVALIIVAVVALLGCILQIVWIRNKLGNYSQTQMAAALTQQSTMMMQLAIPQPTARVFSLLVHAPLTIKFNMISAPENSTLATMSIPQVFSVPQICENKYTSGSISCNAPSYLVFHMNESAADMIGNVQKGAVMYIMIKSILYLARYDHAFQSVLDNAGAYYVLALYTIQSAQNVSTEGDGCAVSIVPFFGTLSNDSTATLPALLALSPNGPETVPIHVMAISI